MTWPQAVHRGPEIMGGTPVFVGTWVAKTGDDSCGLGGTVEDRAFAPT